MMIQHQTRNLCIKNVNMGKGTPPFSLFVQSSSHTICFSLAWHSLVFSQSKAGRMAVFSLLLLGYVCTYKIIMKQLFHIHTVELKNFCCYLLLIILTGDHTLSYNMLMLLLYYTSQLLKRLFSKIVYLLIWYFDGIFTIINYKLPPHRQYMYNVHTHII